jgi:hypothetical protein
MRGLNWAALNWLLSEWGRCLSFAIDYWPKRNHSANILLATCKQLSCKHDADSREQEVRARPNIPLGYAQPDLVARSIILETLATTALPGRPVRLGAIALVDTRDADRTVADATVGGSRP